MNLEDYVAVSGLPGLYKMVVNRNNGLIIEDLDSGKKRFASSRKHQFTPLISIGIYTLDDTAELKDVFAGMLRQLDENPPVSTNASASEIADYFAKILPDYDPNQVFTSDMKRVIKWFNFLNDRQLIALEEEKEETEAKESTGSEEKQSPAGESSEADD